MKKDTPQTVKFKVLKRRLKLPHWQIVGLLESLWVFTSINAQDGAIGRFSDEEIAASIEFEDDPQPLIEALIAAGFVDECVVNRLVVHDWEEHCPTWLSSNFKKHNKIFARATKNNGSDIPGGSCVAPRTVLGPSCDRPAKLVEASIPFQSIPAQSNPVLEDSSELGETAHSKPAMSEYEFPIVGNNRTKTWTLPAYKLDEYLEAFPGVDVHAELRKARQFVRDKPKQRKTASGMPRYLSSWLSRVQDSGGRSGGTLASNNKLFNGSPKNGNQTQHERLLAKIAAAASEEN